MTLYDETVASVRALAARAGTAENVLFCEHRPLTSLEASFAGLEQLAADQRAVEDEALRALERLVDAEEGYETALQAIDSAGEEAAAWVRAVLLARALETLDGDETG